MSPLDGQRIRMIHSGGSNISGLANTNQKLCVLVEGGIGQVFNYVVVRWYLASDFL